MYGNNQQQLPVPADQQVVQFMNFEPQYSPAPYPNYNIEQPIQQIMPLLSTLAANEVQHNAQRSALRMFAFNFFGQNGFNNNNFAQLVCGLADFLAFNVAQGNVNNLVQAAQNLAPNYVALTTAALGRQYQGVLQMLDQTTYNHTVQLCNQYDQLAGAIQQFRRAGNSGMMNPGGMGNMGGGNMGRGSNMGGGGGMGDGGSGLTLFSNPNNTGSGSYQGGGGDMRSDRFARQADVNVTRVGEDSPDTGVRIERGGRRMEAPVQTATPQQEAQPYEILADESKMKWRPSQQQPYPLAYIPRTTLSYHKVMPDGVVFQILKPREQGNMDYEKHCLVTSFGATLPTRDARAAAERLEKMQRSLQIRSEAEPLLDEASRALLKSRVYEDTVLFEPSFDSAWLVAMMGRIAARDDEGNLPDIYQRRTVVATPVFTKTNELDFIKELSTCTSYSQARIKMLDLQTRMSPELWYACETRLTEAVNRLLSLKMSISMNIDSFTEDVADVVGALRKSYGEIFAQAFEASVSELLLAEFDLLDMDMTETQAFLTENYTTNFLNDEKFAAEAPKLTYLSSTVTLTLLNCLATELETELSTKHGVMVGSSTPFLYELAQQIVHEVGASSASRHFIRTLDGRIIEVAEGLIGNGVYVMKIVR
jgi:hypothetical protein